MSSVPCRTITLLVLTCSALAVLTRSASAHPLGNFTINHYSRIELAGDALRVRYVLDLAEVPSVQETRAADTDGDGSVSPAEWDAYKQRKVSEIMQQLDLSIDGQKVELEPTDTLVAQPIGQADIPLVRVEAWFKAVRPIAPNVQHQAVFRDRSDPARLGWREIVVHAGRGAAVSDANAPPQDVSNELRSYPDELLQNPLDRREARWSFVMNGTVSASDAVATSTAVNRPSDPFAALVTATELNPTVVLLALLGAAFLGGIHAASPGHGKSIMAAYIVGTRGTFLHASVLAMSVTLAHTTGVLVLGILTVLASNVIFPERLYPWLTLLSGLIVLVVGGRFLFSALRGRAAEDHHHHHHHNDHDLDHDHHHSETFAPTWKSLFALGISGGVVPSGSALVVLLSSVGLGRLGFGLVLIVAFGVGMALVLVTTGVLLVHAGHLMLRFFPEHADESPIRRRIGAAVPMASASLMTLLGIVATYQGLAQLGFGAS